MNIDDFKIWNPTEHLTTAEMVAYYLEAILEVRDPQLLSDALEDIRESKGMAALTEATGLTFSDLRKLFEREENPAIVSTFKAMEALGLQVFKLPAAS